MEKVQKICCYCIHYRHGDLEDPCAKGQKKCGYLHVGCWRWQSESGKEIEMPTKVCSICGKELTIDKFYVDSTKPGGYSPACKKCFSWKDKILKQKEEREKKEARQEASIPNLERGVKVCNHCKRELPISEFGKHAKTRDGYQPLCKECKGKQMVKAHKVKKDRNANRTNRC